MRGREPSRAARVALDCQTTDAAAAGDDRPFTGGLLERIAPAEAVESGEIGVVAVQFGLVFDRERGELGVGREVTGCAELFEIIEEKAGEPRSGFENNNCWLIQP